MNESINGNGKMRWTYFSRRLGKNCTPRTAKYLILLLNTINSINQGIEPDIESLDTMDLDDDKITKTISFEDLQKQVIESYFINSDAYKSDDDKENVNRRRITIRYENNADNEIPRN